MSYIETRTQEDAQEFRAQGYGCKACEQPIPFGEATACQGDIYCFACGLELDRMDDTGDVRVLPTREQVAELARWAEQGIGTN